MAFEWDGKVDVPRIKFTPDEIQRRVRDDVVSCIKIELNAVGDVWE